MTGKRVLINGTYESTVIEEYPDHVVVSMALFSGMKIKKSSIEVKEPTQQRRA